MRFIKRAPKWVLALRNHIGSGSEGTLKNAERRRLVVSLFMSVVAILGSVAAGLLLAAPASAQAAPSRTVATVRGSDGALWYEIGGAGWQSLGGHLLDTPAVAGLNGVPVFAAIGTDHQMYIADQANPNWLGLGGYCIYTPGVAVFNNDLVLSCAGGNAELWYESVPTADLTGTWNAATIQGYANTWQTAGGTLGAGPAVAGDTSNGTLYFVAETPNHQVWFDLGGNTPNWVATTFYCNGHVTATVYGSTVSAGCQGIDGQMYSGSTTNGTLPGSWSAQGGTLLGGPGIAGATDPSQSVLFAEATDHTVWYAVSGTGNWQSIGGYATDDGVNAANIGPAVNYEADDGTSYYLSSTPLSVPNTNAGYEDAGVVVDIGAASSFSGISATGSSNLAANVWIGDGSDATTSGTYPLASGVNFCYGLGSVSPTTGTVTSYFMTGSQTACGGDYGKTIPASQVASDFAGSEAYAWVGVTSNGSDTVTGNVTSINDMPVSAAMTLNSTSAGVS